MKRHFKHEFVNTMPAQLEEGTVYVSIPYATAMHKCACGCGNEVVTPISPTDWELTFDGETISLYPSIGNWNLACQSHYWIRHNHIHWARRWSRRQIENSRKHDRLLKQEYSKKPDNKTRSASPPDGRSARRLWRRLKERFQ